MTIARACRPPAQAFCRRLAGRWWIAQHPPGKWVTRVGSLGRMSPLRTTPIRSLVGSRQLGVLGIDHRFGRVVAETGELRMQPTHRPSCRLYRDQACHGRPRSATTIGTPVSSTSSISLRHLALNSEAETVLATSKSVVIPHTSRI